MNKNISRFAATLAFAVSATALAGQAQTMPVRIRGTVQSVAGGTLVLSTAKGPVRIKLIPDTKFADIVPSDRAHVKPGTFLGIASVTDPDGKERAVEISVFPESMRGSGEGSYPWDWPGAGGGGKAPAHSRMTNGTVAPVATAPPHSRMTNGTVGKQSTGGSLTLAYKGVGGTGQQAIVVPPSIPIVTFAPGSIKDLTPGAHVFVIASGSPAAPAAQRVMIGKNGLMPPM